MYFRSSSFLLRHVLLDMKGSSECSININQRNCLDRFKGGWGSKIIAKLALSTPIGKCQDSNKCSRIIRIRDIENIIASTTSVTRDVCIFSKNTEYR